MSSAQSPALTAPRLYATPLHRRPVNTEQRGLVSSATAAATDADVTPTTSPASKPLPPDLPPRRPLSNGQPAPAHPVPGRSPELTNLFGSLPAPPPAVTQPEYITGAYYAEQMPAITRLNGEIYANHEYVMELQGGATGRIGHWDLDTPPPYSVAYQRAGLARADWDEILGHINGLRDAKAKEVHIPMTIGSVICCTALCFGFPTYKWALEAGPEIRAYFNELNPRLQARGIPLSFHCENINVTSPRVCNISVYYSPL